MTIKISKSELKNIILEELEEIRREFEELGGLGKNDMG